MNSILNLTLLERYREGPVKYHHFRYLQHFQAPQSSEGSILDAADVVFIQLTAEHTGQTERLCYTRHTQSFPSPCGVVVIIDTVSSTLMDYGKSILVQSSQLMYPEEQQKATSSVVYLH